MSLQEIKQKIVPILRSSNVEYAGIFGSVARGEDRPDSDVDILVRLGRPTGLVSYIRLINNLEEVLKKKVDVVTENSLRKDMKSNVIKDLKPIYER